MGWKAMIIQNWSVSIVHSSFPHGMISLGWEGEEKITIFELDAHHEDYECSVADHGFDTKKEKEKFKENKKKYKNYKKEMFAFWLPVAQDIAERLNKQYPDGMPEFND